jgi:hypothetical protein
MILSFGKSIALENSTFLGYHAMSSGNFLPTFRDRYVLSKRQHEIITTHYV